MKMVLIVYFLLSAFIYSQEDIKGSKDHALFNRMHGYRIARYDDKEFGVLKDFKYEKGKKMNVEGHYYFLVYELKKGEKPATNEQIVRNYINAVKKAGGEIVFEDACCDAYLKLKNNDRIIWVHVHSHNDGPSYQLWIVEEAEMEQIIVVDAKTMLSDINAQGRVALYGIYFDFDKSDVKPESDPTLKEIAKLLSENPKLNLYVVGHTDNVGDYKYNMKLSEARADAVVKTLVSKYNVDKKRLTSAGVGPLAPVTSNDTEEGKAKNRRVELIKK